ncbi:hypothetical protein Pogu_1327 [Pyrobaculum oguniense TE7]|uniref:Uncharacterized protein n=1 Tax=Pyrobaculum oguniense (strain DSM 13380 / JCM 10595 / TE7) TaxID=698757 RepID=H6Q8X5_PYROT|nr:hypothetical protein Pogu_1327 [Pyrobaculum oguniense TE7]
MVVWHVIGKSEPLAFYKATVDLVKSTQMALFMSAFFFLAGVAVPSNIHGYLMTLGLLSFYHAVMYVQLPGFINAMPHRAATWGLSTSFIVGAVGFFAVGYAAFLPYAVLHAFIYYRGLRGAPTYYPNWVTVTGLLLLPLSANHLEAIFSFPLASVYSLLYRIDSSRARRKFTARNAAVLTALYAAAFIGVKLGYLWAMLAPSLFLTLAAPPKVNDKYGAGSFFFRWAVALAPFGHHFAYTAFAVIMSVLCVPYFIGAILFRQIPTYGIELIATAALAYVSRILGALPVSALAVVALVIYTAVRTFREKYYPPTPPS